MKIYKEMSLIFGVILVLFAFVILDIIKGIITEEEAIIYNESYAASTEQTGSGVAFTSKGVAPVITHSGHPEEFSLIVKYNDKEYEKITVSVSVYYSVKINQKVKVKTKHGYFTGITYHKKVEIL